MSMNYYIQDAYLIPNNDEALYRITHTLDEFIASGEPYMFKYEVFVNSRDQKSVEMWFDDRDQTSNMADLMKNLIVNELMPHCAKKSFITVVEEDNNDYRVTFIKDDSDVIIIEPTFVHIGAPEWFIRDELQPLEEEYDYRTAARVLCGRPDNEEESE